MKHAHIPSPIPDPLGIGQPKLARIHMRIADHTLAEVAPSCIDTAETWDEWREMQIRRAKQAIAFRQHAQAILEAYQS